MYTVKLVGFVAALGLATVSAAAPPAAPAAKAGSVDDRPWARGVSQERQHAALLLFREGNAALKESLFLKATQKYREALKEWDHPAVHYNLALALVNLDQPVETYEHLEAALKYGAAPLDSDKFDQARRYKSLVEKQLARIDVVCNEPGALVKMDGVTLFTAPGSHKALIRAGPHTIIAAKEGFITVEESKVLPAGMESKFDLKLDVASAKTVYKTLWPSYVQWLVIGGGVALAGTGLAMHLAAGGSYDAYDADIASCASTGGGFCQPSGAIVSRKQAGDTLQPLAFVFYGLGGAAIVTGAILAYINRPIAYTVTTGTEVKASLWPSVSPDGVGARFHLAF